MRSVSNSLKILEALCQVLVGGLLIWVSNKIFFYVFAIPVSAVVNTYLVVLNTVIAFFKAFFVRSWFERRFNNAK